jgi:hypothetical protein
MRTQSFVIIENDVSEHADMSLLYTTIRPEGGGPECSDGARIVAEAEEAALGVLTAQVEGCMDARAGSVHGLRELGYATTTAKRTFNVKQGEGMLKELWPPGQSGDEARTRLNCAFRFLENVCAFSYIVLMSKVREGMSREQALEELKRHGALYDTAAADGPVSASVLQCFWYPNSDGVRENPNCGEHVDQVRETVLLTICFPAYVLCPKPTACLSISHTHPFSLYFSLHQGFLSIEPATAVPGLEVFDFASQSWLSIDLHLNPGDLILFNAETVQRVTRDVCRGTVHRVGKNEAARLSMVFKMRHRASEELGEYLNHHDAGLRYSLAQHHIITSSSSSHHHIIIIIVI